MLRANYVESVSLVNLVKSLASASLVDTSSTLIAYICSWHTDGQLRRSLLATSIAQAANKRFFLTTKCLFWVINSSKSELWNKKYFSSAELKQLKKGTIRKVESWQKAISFTENWTSSPYINAHSTSALSATKYILEACKTVPRRWKQRMPKSLRKTNSYVRNAGSKISVMGKKFARSTASNISIGSVWGAVLWLSSFVAEVNTLSALLVIMMPWLK